MIVVGPVLINRDTWTDGQRLHYVRSLTFSGSYVTGGDSLSLNLQSIKSATVPFWASVRGQGGNKYFYAFIPGPAPATCKVKITDTTTGLELAAGSYPNAILVDVVSLYAITLPMQ